MGVQGRHPWNLKVHGNRTERANLLKFSQSKKQEYTTAKRILERHGTQASSSSVKI